MTGTRSDVELSPLVAAAAKATGGERPAPRPTSSGLPQGEAENARVQVADLGAGTAAEMCRCGRVHQPRERAVPCRVCHRPTPDHHAICTACQATEMEAATG